MWTRSQRNFAMQWLAVMMNLVAVMFVAGEQCSAPVVTTSLGEARGFCMHTRKGHSIAAFTSVPYALPPIGDLRFKGPVAVTAEQWGLGGLDATRSPQPCVQRNPYIRQKEIVGDEDCLYLNIYVPDAHLRARDEKKPLPVMVFVHGGGWMCGDSTVDSYGPELLLDRDVLLVTLNYRLGPLGFLSTQDEVCPGNNGLKDQQEALRFVQRHIHNFGGDNRSVTIFGESAGGASVHFHMLSDTSAGLFARAISESGTALVPWAESPPGEALRQAFRLAKFLGCPQAPSWRMIECLRTRDSYEIIDTEFTYYEWDYEPMTPFKAVVEPDLPEAFLTRPPRAPRTSPAPPWLMGLNRDEGCLKSVWITSNRTRYEEFLSGFDRIAPLTFYYENSPHADVITRILRERYLNQPDELSTQQAIRQIYGDSYFAYPALEAVHLALNSSTVYLYELAYRASNSFSQVFGDPHGDYGVCHADELMHLFPIRFLSEPVSERDLAISELILTLWTNFATTGDPNKPLPLPTEWRPTRTGSRLDIWLKMNSRPCSRDLPI
ncbi:juvenile hormone esterase-like [Leptidea sinapis]|uniref:juvenile hormone esterase-like n=1 Tax=Leptidea sinapis TaxID=189913 RepID=UPI0021C30407|nr:juvenile hormone esterase-like [Leptidea sinapis]